MRLKTRVFELRNGRYSNLSELAQAMGISVSQVYRVRKGQKLISEKFIIGAIEAFPEYKLDDLFYVALRQIVKGDKPTLRSKAMLRIGDVAQVLGLHANTVRRWSEKGILKSYRIGSRGDRRFLWEDVDGFLKEREIE